MAIYDSINSETKKNAKAEMLNALFSKATFHSEYTPKLEHSKFDKSDYEKVICFEKNKEDFAGKEEGILGCYNHFIKRINITSLFILITNIRRCDSNSNTWIITWKISYKRS